MLSILQVCGHQPLDTDLVTKLGVLRSQYQGHKYFAEN